MTDHTTLTRRTTLAGATALALAPLAALAQGAPGAGPGHAQGEGRAPAQVAGIVYEDRGAKGRRGPDDPGLPDVLVSNGREVARTDAQGRYTLPVGDEVVIFVVKPTGFALPPGPDGLPHFSYLHQPAGTRRISRSAIPASRRPDRCRHPSISAWCAARKAATSTSCCSPIPSRKATPS